MAVESESREGRGGGEAEAECELSINFVAHQRLVSVFGFSGFEKMKCIFSIAPVGHLEKSWECFSLRNTYQTLALEAPNAEPTRLVYC